MELFGSRNQRSNVKAFDVRLDEQAVVLRGAPDEAAGALLSGSLHLELGRNTSIKAIRLTLEGRRTLRWVDTTLASTASQRLHKKDECVYEKHWSFLPDEKTYELGSGVHEFPFSVVLPGSTPESVEGLIRAGLRYRLKAELVRNWPRAEIVAFKPVRVIRTLLPSALELSQTLAVENVWPEKIDYSIVIPQKAVVFGTHIPIEIVLTPLIKGLSPGKIGCTLQEYLTLNVGGRKGKVVEKRDIVTKYIDNVQITHDDDVEKWVVRERIQLPKSLLVCVQDCESGFIKIRHKMKFAIQIQNPDEHLSELRANIPVSIFISPNLLMNEAGYIEEEIPDYVEEVEELPVYSERSSNPQIPFFDIPAETYYHGGIDSGLSTPYPFSNNSSMTDVSGLRSAASSMLVLSRPTSSSSLSDMSDYFSPTHPHTSILNPSANESLRRLCRVPSYATAIRTLNERLEVDHAPVYEETPTSTPMTSPMISPAGSPRSRSRQLHLPQLDISELIPRRQWTAARENPKVTVRSMVALQEMMEE